jgi:hypothetical protein
VKLLILIPLLFLAACASAQTVPSPPTGLSASEQDGLAAIQEQFPVLKHIFKEELATIDSESFAGSLDHMDHYSTDWEKFWGKYLASNGGDYYGGRVKPLERKFEHAANHVRRLGLRLLGMIERPSDQNVERAVKEQFGAEAGIEAVEAELRKLEP